MVYWIKWSTPLFTGMNLSMKSARWAIKLLYKEMKKEQSRTCKAIIGMINVGFLTIWNNVLTVGESARGEVRAGRPNPRPWAS
jgi:hypothetical protein